MDVATLIAFALAFFVFAASPGPDNLTIMARTVSHGWASGLAYGLGTVTGILIFLAAAVFGLSVIASEMGVVMTILRYAGAVWLIWTGIRLWTAKPDATDLAERSRDRGLLPAYATGVLLNLGNPKMPLFYIALLPNVVGAEIGPMLAVELALVILAVEAVVIAGHLLIAQKGRRLMTSPVFARRVNRAAGSVMIGTGAIAIAAR
ncbi:LysE family translocator [Rhizobium sp. FKL33]|uniref:LysE family translocator n=1 Tax=Rhizobium sp. FKL33 TaxID=2562307 RepID=UPI0010BF8E6A|nr:LysE family translocator [Rhizobium sp. FKL33]